MSFGPQDFARDKTGVLFGDGIGPVRAHARSDSLWGQVAEAIGKKAVEIGKGVLRGYSRDEKAAYAYARTGIPTAGDVPGGYSKIDALLGSYGASRASQPWLKEVTGKSNYVFGAAVPEGPDEGIYVDEGLVRKAGKYISSLARGLKQKAREYASDFIETLLTLDHEYAHKNKGIRNDQAAEQYAEESLIRLAKDDSTVGFALQEYRSPLLLAD
ncbi:MAG: hypothetical protein JXC85_02790 [Candidatus Aenigmarchaeota archaeon]|nr:hypothetical protein [Candidatus Aenigmarchaeota archaeon]